MSISRAEMRNRCFLNIYYASKLNALKCTWYSNAITNSLAVGAVLYVIISRMMFGVMTKCGTFCDVSNSLINDSLSFITAFVLARKSLSRQKCHIFHVITVQILYSAFVIWYIRICINTVSFRTRQFFLFLCNKNFPCQGSEIASVGFSQNQGRFCWSSLYGRIVKGFTLTLWSFPVKGVDLKYTLLRTEWIYCNICLNCSPS